MLSDGNINIVIQSIFVFSMRKPLYSSTTIALKLVRVLNQGDVCIRNTLADSVFRSSTTGTAVVWNGSRSNVLNTIEY